jgi:hypothetical protein
MGGLQCSTPQFDMLTLTLSNGRVVARVASLEHHRVHPIIECAFESPVQLNKCEFQDTKLKLL